MEDEELIRFLILNKKKKRRSIWVRKTLSLEKNIVEVNTLQIYVLMEFGEILWEGQTLILKPF